MEGKIKLRIGSKSSFWNRRYKVFLNGNSVGNIDYKNSQISFGANKGNNLLLVKSKTFEKELNLDITDDKIIFPVEITENWGANHSKFKLSKLMNGLKIGFLIVLTFTFSYLTLIENKNMTPFIPIVIIISLGSFFKKTDPFDLEYKKF